MVAPKASGEMGKMNLVRETRSIVERESKALDFVIAKEAMYRE